MKHRRHKRILELIKETSIETQDELGIALLDSGFNVTQATISRDIKELRLTKVLTNDGKYKYATLTEGKADASQRFINLFKDSVLKFDSAGNIVVIKTLIGAANAAAAAIDAFDIEEVVGTIAGDDTIFLLLRNEEQVKVCIDKFENILTK